MTIVLCLIALGIFLYWLGGQAFAHTLFRDLGCSLCIFAIAFFALGWHMELLTIIPFAWVGFTIGDHEKWYWSIHGFVVAFSMLPFALAHQMYLLLLVELFVVTLGTYLVSRFWNRYGVDVIGRGLLYATAPLWFLIGR